MGARFLLGPAGSGKTWRCLAGIRAALRDDPDGPPLLFLAPKQATFQLERQLLAEDGIRGFARLQILSFERLAFWILRHLGRPEPRLLGDVGRTMVLRGVLESEAGRLAHLGRAARTPGFARELSRWLGQLIQLGNDPARLESVAARPETAPILRAKLGDLARVQRGYSEWLLREGLSDKDQLLEIARQELSRTPRGTPLFDGVWMDGFAEMTPLETALLAEVVGRSRESTLAFCVDADAASTPGSFWSVVADCFRRCHAAVAAATEGGPVVEKLGRSTGQGRFASSPVLAALESGWATGNGGTAGLPESDAIRVLVCADAHAEAECAAEHVLAHVAAGGRYRDAAVLSRTLDSLGPILERTFHRRGIPCFLDQRFPIRHHPLVELTRSAVRIVSDPAGDDDWFAWLKCGLLGLPEWAAERAENALLRLRWEGHRWTSVDGVLEAGIPDRVVGPIHRFGSRLVGTVTGATLAAALRALWADLDLERVLEEWDRIRPDMFSHRTVLRESEAWLDELVRGFGNVGQPLAGWMPILETAWSAMTAGAIPPALDQVLLGTIDRSRNPDLRLVVLPGWAEDVFPAPPPADGLLSRAELERLSEAGLNVGPEIVARVAHERFYAYIALTRTRQKVVVTIPSRSSAGRPLLPSPFVRMLPRAAAWISPRDRRASAPECEGPVETLTPDVARSLMGTVWDTSASGLEQAAACLLQHGLSRALSVRERTELEFDSRAEGSLQHELLAEFHRRVRRIGRRWRDIQKAEATALLAAIKGEMLDQVPTTNEFEWEVTFRSVVRFVLAWLEFAPDWPLDPTHAELKFGKGAPLPAISLPLAHGVLRINGSIDRVDMARGEDEENGVLCAIDYKLSGERFSREDLESGRQLQLPIYLMAALGLAAGPYRPAGMAYAALSPIQCRLKRRNEPGDGNGSCSRYPHRGRIDSAWAKAAVGTDWSRSPFAVRFRKDGAPDGRADAVASEGIEEILEIARMTCVTLGDGILGGEWKANPAITGTDPVCEYCAVRTACRYPSK